MIETKKGDQSTGVEVTNDLIVTLSNGLRVANFSSGHPFIFEDGTVLPARSEFDMKRLTLNFIETEREFLQNGIKYSLIELKWLMSSQIRSELDYWMKEYTAGKIDIVIIPFPVLQVMRDTQRIMSIINSPFRVIRRTERGEKAPIHIDKYCI